MIAVKYSSLYKSLDTPFNYPVSKIDNVTVLPEGFDALLTQAEYDQLILDNKPLVDAYKAEEASKLATASLPNKFKAVREKWQEMADKFASDNVSSGITTAEAKVIADGFSQVKYYLETNVPMQAIAEIDSITTDANFLTLTKRDEMKAELLAFVQSTFGI